MNQAREPGPGILEYTSCVWNTGLTGHLRLLESGQRTWTRHISGMSDLPYADRLTMLDLYSVQERLLQTDLIKYWKIFRGECGTNCDIFTLALLLGTRGYRYKILPLYCAVEARRRYFCVRCVGLWNSLPDEVVAQSSVSSFQSAFHTNLGPRLYEIN